MRIERTLEALLNGKDPSGEHPDEKEAMPVQSKPKHRPKKGDRRIVVSIGDIEASVFGDRQDPTKVFGRNKNRAKRGVPDSQVWKSVDMDDDYLPDEIDVADGAQIESRIDEGEGFLPGSHIRPSQSISDVNFSVGGERGWTERIDETPEMLQKRREGQQRADERELIKKAARRAVVFGLLTDAPTDQSKKPTRKSERENEALAKVQKKCEALMNDNVVEPSFAKGDWSLRWRED